MITVVYTATVTDSTVSPSFISGTEYTLTFRAKVITPSRAIVRNQSRSLAGTSETLKHRDENFRDITTTAIDEADMPALRNFINSTMDGSTFTIDLDSGSPLNLVSAEMESDSYSEERIEISLDTFNVGFKIRLL